MMTPILRACALRGLFTPYFQSAGVASRGRKQHRDDDQYACHFYLLDTNQRKLNLNSEAI